MTGVQTCALPISWKFFISNAATGKINIIGGTNTGQSGLTTAQTYYVATTGILTTTADTPSVVAGTSVSDTEILVWKS